MCSSTPIAMARPCWRPLRLDATCHSLPVRQLPSRTSPRFLRGVTTPPRIRVARYRANHCAHRGVRLSEMCLQISDNCPRVFVGNSLSLCQLRGFPLTQL
jgi:hypothetical protein